MNKARITPVIQVLAAACLSGLSVPVSRLLLDRIGPLLLSALLYLGSAAGLLILTGIRRLAHYPIGVETRLRRADLPWLTGSIVFGGIAAPILLMTSLRITPPATASLLLNFETAATMLLAAAFFGESVGRRVVFAAVFITAGSILLTLETGNGWGISVGALGVLGTATLWGLDNNMMRKIAMRDPVVISGVKGLAGGIVSLGLALGLEAITADVFTVIAALLVGAVSYGVALVLFITAMRKLGAARTSAVFGTAPFWGTIAAFFIFREIQWAVFVSLPLMAAGMYILLGEREE